MSRIMNFRKVTLTLAILATIMLGSAAIARADNATFQLNTGSTLPNQNYGTLGLVLNGNGSITISIALLDGNRIIETGQNVAIGFNSSLAVDPSITVSGLPAGYSFTAGVTDGPGDFGADGFGTFDYRIRSSNGANDLGALSNLSFTVFCTSCAGGIFSSVFDLVSNSTNPPGTIQSPFAIDIFCPTCNGGQGATGFIGTTSQPIPEPASMLLLGSGLLGAAAGIRRRRIRKS